MVKPLVWAGLVLIVLSAALFALFVFPHLSPASVGPAAPAHDTRGPISVAVIASGLGLAGGAALVGIGLGRWKRPRPSRSDGSPEV